VFSTQEFQQWAQDGKAVLFASVMTKIDGREDDELLRTYGFRGFPSLALLDGAGEMITKDVQRNLDSMASLCAAAPNYLELQAAAKSGKVDAGEWLLARLSMGGLDFEQASAERAKLDLTGDQAKAVDAAVFGLEVRDLQAKARPTRGQEPPDVDAIAGRIYESFEQGMRLPESSPSHGFYVDHLLAQAVEHKNAKAFFHAYPHVVANLETSIARGESQIESWEKTLAGDVEERMVQRYKDAIDRSKKMIESQRKRIVELGEQAAEMKGKK